MYLSVIYCVLLTNGRFRVRVRLQAHNIFVTVYIEKSHPTKILAPMVNMIKEVCEN